MPRRWFQLHLSTGIVLMFVAGGLMWLNNVPGMIEQHSLTVILGYEHKGASRKKLEAVGWPWKIYDSYYVTINNIVPPDPELGGVSYWYDRQYVTLKYCSDLGVAILILYSTAFLLERRIRTNPKSQMRRDPKSEESTVH